MLSNPKQTSDQSISINPKSSKSSRVLFLKQSHVTFEAPTQKVSVFFDECNREIISLTSEAGSKTKVLFQATDRFDKVQFILPVEKKILSIKFNPLRTVLAYHVEKSNIEFINVQTSRDAAGQLNYLLTDKRYVQPSRTKTNKLFGFLWTGNLELVMITDISIEYYQVDTQRRRLKFIKSFQSSTNWFVYQPPIYSQITGCQSDNSSDPNAYSILMVSTGFIGNSIQPYMFDRKQIIKLQRFDVDGNWHGSDKLELFERSITIASLYGQVRLLVLQHESLNVKSKGAQILVYTVDHETGLTVKTHTLDLDVSGRFAINILDNLIIAHDQPSKKSFIYDIMIDSTEKSDCPKHYVSLVDSQPIRPLLLEGKSERIEMYSLNWVFFQPNFIIDARIGLLSTLHLDLFAIREVIQDDLILLSFLAHRRYSEQIILSKCGEIVTSAYKNATSGSLVNSSPLADVSSTFEVLGKLIVSAPDIQRKPAVEKQPISETLSTKSTRDETLSGHCIALQQEDIHREVFRKLESATPKNSAHFHFVSSALLELIFVIQKQDKKVEFCIVKQLLNTLVQGGRFYQLVQMIRSGIFSDSKQLACLLLSLKGQYKPATQLGLEMLGRLNCLTDLIETLRSE